MGFLTIIHLSLTIHRTHLPLIKKKPPLIDHFLAPANTATVDEFFQGITDMQWWCLIELPLSEGGEQQWAHTLATTPELRSLPHGP